jgi:hypothetical protein
MVLASRFDKLSMTPFFVSLSLSKAAACRQGRYCGIPSVKTRPLVAKALVALSRLA